MRRQLLTLLQSLMLLVATSSLIYVCAQAESAESPAAPTGEIGDGNQAFVVKMQKGLEDLKAKTGSDFAAICEAIATEIDDNIELAGNPDDPNDLVTLVTSGVTRTMNIKISSEDGLRDDWQKGYDKLIHALRSGEIAGFNAQKSSDWVGLYRLASTVLRSSDDAALASTPVLSPEAQAEVQAPAGEGISESAFASENLVDRVVEGMSAPDLQLTKDTRFQITCLAIISKLEQLRQEVKDDLETMSGKVYLEKLRKAFKDGISDPKIGNLIRERWVKAYNHYEGEFVKAGDEDDPKTWDHAAVLLITALNKAIGIDKQWENVAASAAPSNAAAQGAGTGYSTGISPHTARKIRWISNRAAIHRARTQAILGR